MTARQGIVRDALAIGAAAGVFGVSFGAVAATKMSLLEIVALSTLTFTGASQFALASVLASGGSAYLAVAGALLLGVRNTLYALRISEVMPRALWPLRAHFVIDETTGMTLVQETDANRRFAFAATASSVFVFWNLATLVGALLGPVLGSPRSLGLDVAGPAVFMALAIGMIKRRSDTVFALASAAATLVALVIFR